MNMFNSSGSQVSIRSVGKAYLALQQALAKTTIKMY